MRYMTHAERVNVARAEAHQETLAAQKEWEKGKRDFEMRLDNMRARLSGIRAERKRLVEASAWALLQDEAFDVMVLSRLAAEETQAERALQILEAKYTVEFVRCGPPVIRAEEVRPGFEIVREPRAI